MFKSKYFKVEWWGLDSYIFFCKGGGGLHPTNPHPLFFTFSSVCHCLTFFLTLTPTPPSTLPPTRKHTLTQTHTHARTLKCQIPLPLKSDFVGRFSVGQRSLTGWYLPHPVKAALDLLAVVQGNQFLGNLYHCLHQCNLLSLLWQQIFKFEIKSANYTANIFFFLQPQFQKSHGAV